MYNKIYLEGYKSLNTWILTCLMKNIVWFLLLFFFLSRIAVDPITQGLDPENCWSSE